MSSHVWALLARERKTFERCFQILQKMVSVTRL